MRRHGSGIGCAAPAGREGTLLAPPGGAGTPLGGAHYDPCEELANGGP